MIFIIIVVIMFASLVYVLPKTISVTREMYDYMDRLRRPGSRVELELSDKFDTFRNKLSVYGAAWVGLLIWNIARMI